MLTKEQCKNALDNILCNIGVAHSDYRTSGKAKEDYHTLKSLIEEHFSNPPLKFEELKEGMLVYDKVRGSWAEIDKTVDKTHDGVQNVVFCWVIGWDIQKIIEYKPNRFYRKEVQE